MPFQGYGGTVTRHFYHPLSFCSWVGRTLDVNATFEQCFICFCCCDMNMPCAWAYDYLVKNLATNPPRQRLRWHPVVSCTYDIGKLSGLVVSP